MTSLSSSRDDDSRPLGLDQRFAEAYEELKRVAHRRLEGEAAGHTLDTTALVNETWVRLAPQRAAEYANREQFFALAAMAMRRILVDYARRHRANKRSGQRERVSLDGVGAMDQGLAQPSAQELLERAELLLSLDAALEELRQLDGRAASVVECRFFLSMKDEEIAAAHGVTVRTVGRDWARARAWLRGRLGEPNTHVG
jgi:RNA polymerase sigma-70 factor, ECF subfamily